MPAISPSKESTTATVLAIRLLLMPSTMERSSFSQLAILSFFHAVVDSRDFVEFDRRTVAPRHHDLMVVGRLVHLPGGLKATSCFVRSAFDRGRGVGARDRGANVLSDNRARAAACGSAWTRMAIFAPP